MSILESKKMMNVVKFMTKKELEDMRDEIRRGRTWGTILTGVLIGGLGFLSPLAAKLAFVFSSGFTAVAAFQRGADNRIDDILSDYNTEEGVHIVLRAEGTFDISLSEIKSIEYKDVVGVIDTDNIGEWV